MNKNNTMFYKFLSVLFSLILFIQYIPQIEIYAESINLHVWVSTEAMGEESKFFTINERCYLCYELTDSNGNLINGYNDYNVKMKIFNPDGSIRYEYDYQDSNNNWISSVMTEQGYFNATVFVTGNIEGSCDITGRVIPQTVDIYTWLSRTGMGNELNKDEETICIGDNVYFCYKILDMGTDNLINECCNIEVIQKFVSPDGEVYDYKYDNNNNWFCITPGTIGKWNYYLEIKGDYDTIISDSFYVVDFKYGRDNWSFNNSSDYFTHGNYFLNDRDSTLLYNNLTLIEQARITMARYYNWGGSCYGMTALAALIRGNEFFSSNLDNNPKNLFAADSPNFNNNIESAINYYQLLQNTNIIQQYKAMYAKKFTQSDIINQLTAITQQNNCNISPFLLAFSGTFWGKENGGHAVMVYDYEDGDYIWNNNNYNKMFKIYDPNSLIHDNKRCLYVNTNTNTWCIPSYQLGSNQNNGRLSYLIYSYNILNHHGLYGSTDLIESEDFYSILSMAAIDNQMSISMIKKSADGLVGGLGDSTISVDDEIDIFYDVFGEDITTATLNAILPKNNVGYIFKTDKSDNYNLQMNYEDLFYQVTADKGEKVKFLPDGECRIDSNGGNCSICTVFNNYNECPITYSNIKIENADTTYMNLSKKYGMFLLESESLNDCSISFVTDYTTNSTISFDFSSNGQKAYVYQKNDDIAVQVVGDLNGDYEINVLDAAILKKCLFSQETDMPEIWQIIDISENEKIDIFDLVKLKNLLISKNI